MKIKTRITAFSALCAAALYAGVSAQAQTFKIGVITLLSGPAAESYGTPNINSTKLMVDKINKGEVPAPYASKGIAGMPIELVILDEAAGTDRMLDGVRSLVEKEHVDAILGPIASGNCLAISPIVEQLQKFTILSDCGTPRVFEERAYKYVFRAGAHTTMDGASMAKYLVDSKMLGKSMGAINQDYAYGQDNWSDFKGVLDQLAPGVAVTQTLWPKFGAGQYGAEISALSRQKGELIFSSFWGGDLQAFLMQGAPRGLFRDNKLALLAGAHVMPMMGKRFPEGVVIGERGAIGPLARSTPLSQWFTKEYEQAYKASPDSASAYRIVQSLLGMKLAVEKAAQAKGGAKPTSEEIAKAMEYLQFDTPSGMVKMTLGNGHQAIQDAAVGITKWDDKKNKIVVNNIRYYPAECINPPASMKSADWIKAGLPGVKDCR